MRQKTKDARGSTLEAMINIIFLIAAGASAVLNFLGRKADLESSVGQLEANRFFRGKDMMFVPKKYVLWSIVIAAVSLATAPLILHWYPGLHLGYALIPFIISMVFGGLLGFKDAARNNKITGRKV